MVKPQMDTTRFTANRSYSIPVVVFTAGWFLLFIGLCVMQGRFNQLIGNVAHTPFSLFWFFIFFWLFTAAIFIGAIVMDEMARAKSLIQQLMSISFVFVILALESTTSIVETFRTVNDNYKTGSGFMMTGLLCMVFSLLYLIVTLNTDLSDYMPKPKEEVKKMSMTDSAESMTPIDISTETPAVVKVEAV